MDDPVPEHVMQTFKLVHGSRDWESDLSGIEVAVEGGNINMQAAGYVIVYASNTWHQGVALELHNQIKALRHEALVLAIPVEVEVKEVEETPFQIGLVGNTIPIPRPPFPGKP